MRTQHSPVVIFSLKQIPEIFQWMDACVRVGSCKRVTGCYKGVEEQSLMMQAGDFYARGMSEVCAQHEQESVLFLDGQRGAWLRFAPAYDEDGQVYLGQWKHVEKAAAIARDAWTRDDSTGRYYIAK